MSRSPTVCNPRHFPPAKTRALICRWRWRCGSPVREVWWRITAASMRSTGTCTWSPRVPTRVVACCATQPMICSAARVWAASYAVEMRGSSAAASDQVFGPLTNNFGEPHAVRGLHQPALRRTGADVVASHPPLIGLTIHCGFRNDGRPGGGVSIGQASALGEVVVVGPGTVRLDIVAGGRSRSTVDRNPTPHSPPPVTSRQRPLKWPSARPSGRTDLRTFVACVPLDFGTDAGRGRGWVRNSSLVVTGAIEMLAIGDAWSETLEVSRRPKWCWPHVIVVPSRCRKTPQSRDHHRTAETDSAVPAMPPYQRRCRMGFRLR